MKLWIDDLREPPDDTWMWAKTSDQALLILTFQDPIQEMFNPCIEMSFDHDLGGDDTTRPILMWMCENGFWPKKVNVHSANSVGADWILGTTDRYAPPEVVVTYQGIPRRRSDHR